MGLYQKLRIRHRAYRFLRKSEAAECRLMLSCLQEGMTAVDIGAHKAAYTYWMSRYLGSSGRVFAFEPVPVLARYLQDYAASCGHQNITVCPIALSNQTGPARLRVPGQDYMWSSLNYSADDMENPTEQCEYIHVEKDQLDNQLRHHRSETVGFVKCDVEGHEYAVLSGAKRTLEVDQPVLLVESSPLLQVPASENQSMQLLTSLGYQGYFFYDRQLLAMADHDAKIHTTNSVGIQNFVFIHPERWQLAEPRWPFKVVAATARVRPAA